MTQNYKLLQGTDGIRGRIDKKISASTSNALEYYLETGFLTPEFFELYTYSYGSLLLSLGFIEKNKTIVIGWDPRDQSGQFNTAAISGLLKCGFNVIQAGTLPTPAIPIYMQYINAIGAVVLTASHNPSDQNGIKLFHGFTGLKFLPFDDDLLSKKVFENQSVKINNLEQTGTLEDHSEKAKAFFIDFCLNEKNSWIKDISFNDTILVIDASKGATAEVAQAVFKNYDFKKLVFTNLTGNINENCGVADLEGRESISTIEIVDPGGIFYHYETLNRIIEISKSESKVQSGAIKLVGLVFDGDGDRCYRLDYFPTQDEILISSGDFLGIHQARYLIKKPTKKESHFVNTVESDLNTAIVAKELGYKPVITGVGDKWILRNAVADFIGNHINTNDSQNKEISHQVTELREDEDASGFKISQLWQQYYKNRKPILKMDKLQFRIGIEESGHSITPGVFQRGKKTCICFAGNGIKSGLNALFAMKKNDKSDPGNWFDVLKSPFPTGVNKTYYVYYVDKTKILPGADFREQLIQHLIASAIKELSAEYHFEMVDFPEEKPLIYCRVFKGNNVVGAVFIRNSGTEDKSALYLRGKKEYSEMLMKIGHPVHMYMMKNLKNPQNEFTALENEILESVKAGTSRELLLSKFSDFPIERILKEIELKEHLLERKGGKMELSQKGIEYLQ